MRRLARAASLAIASVAGALAPAHGQSNNPIPPPQIVDRSTPITPLSWYVMGSIACTAVSPMIGTAILGRELTLNEAYRTTFGCLLGPAGWLLADALVPPTLTIQTQVGQPPRQPRRSARGRNFRIPPPGETRFVANEIPA